MSKTEKIIKVGAGAIGRRVITSTKGENLVKKLNAVQDQIRVLENADDLTDAQKATLASKKTERKKIEKELAAEKNKADTKGQITRAGKKEFKGYTPSSPFNKGGMASRKGSFDMRKGGMFMK
jgi:alanyl-tRNA synthetase